MKYAIDSSEVYIYVLFYMTQVALQKLGRYWARPDLYSQDSRSTA